MISTNDWIFYHMTDIGFRTKRPLFPGALLSGALTLGLPSFANATEFTNVGTNLFDFPSANDWSKQWLEYLFFGNPIAQANYPQTFSLQAALRVMLAFYANGILILAAVMLLYHLVAMAVNTAHSGVFMGQRANQVWAPIRLVVAIGLLVPLGGGLNSGQYIVMQVTAWGAGLGSQTWKHFVDGLKEASTDWTYSPAQATDVTRNAHSLFQNYLCMEAYNYSLSQAMTKAMPDSLDAYRIRPIANEVEVVTQLFQKIGLAHETAETRIDFGNDETNFKSICGGYILHRRPALPPSYAARVAEGVNQAETDAFTAALPQFQALAREIMPYFHPQAPEHQKTPPDNKRLTDLIATYQRGMEQAVQQAVGEKNLGLDDPAIQAVLNKALDEGWPTAGSFFNLISREQGVIEDSVRANMPVIIKPMIAQPEKLAVIREGLRWGNNANVQDALLKETLQTLQAASGWMTHALPAGIRNVNTLTENNRASIYAYDITSGEEDCGLFCKSLRALDRTMVEHGVWSNGGIGLTFTETSNPLIELTSLGHKWFAASMKLAFGGAATSATGSIFSAVLPGGVTGALSTAASGLGTAMMVLGTIGFTAAFSLAFLIPLLPFIKFFFNTLTWLLLVFEAVVAMPLLALAHLNPEGEGLAGPAMHGYYLVFNIFLRPVLMVIGLIAGLLLFFVAVGFLNIIFGPTALGASAGIGAMYVISKLVYSVMYVVLVYICANTCFKAIDYFPSHAMGWIGKSGHHEAMGSASVMDTAVGVMAGALGSRAPGTISDVVGGTGSNVVRSIKEREKKKKKGQNGDGKKPTISADKNAQHMPDVHPDNSRDISEGGIIKARQDYGLRSAIEDKSGRLPGQPPSSGKPPSDPHGGTPPHTLPVVKGGLSARPDSGLLAPPDNKPKKK